MGLRGPRSAASQMFAPLPRPRATAVPTPPRPLGTYGTELWERMLTYWDVDGPGALETLAMGCEALDRAETLRQKINADGPVIDTPNGPLDHPLLRHEASARAQVMRCLKQFRLK
jgi:hypothetical protein